MTTSDASAATFKIPYSLFDLPPPVPRGSLIPPTSMRAMGTTIPRRRRLAETNGQLEPPSSGFREYLLFALRTRLTPELKELIGRSVLISFTGYPAPSLRLSLPGGDKEPHINESLRKEIHVLLDRESNLPSHQRLECLLLRWNSVRYLAGPALSSTTGTDGMYEKIPNKWLRSIIPFVSLDSSLREDVEIPKIEYRDGGLYADCLHTAGMLRIDEGESYGDLYSRMAERALAVVRRWYDEGRLVDPEQALVDKWKLEAVRSIEGITLYKPSDDWGLSKLSRGVLMDLPVSALLHDLAKGRHRSVAVRVGINCVDYHEISKRLFGGGLTAKYHFAGGALHFIPKDLEDLLRVLNGVDEVLYGTDNDVRAVATLSSSRLSWINIYSILIQRSITTDITVYMRRDAEPTFVISFVVTPITDLAALRTEIILRARRTFVYLIDYFKKPGHLDPIDIHGLLDDPETRLPEDLSSPTVRGHLKRKKIAESDIQF